MAMNKIPTIVCGIGGIGCMTAQMVSDALTEEDRKYVGVVGVDTNQEDLKALSIVKVCTSDSRLVRDYIKIHPEYKKWFPLSRFTASRGLSSGAGQIRAISRLGMLAADEEGRFTPMKEEIRRILKNTGETNTSSVNIFIVGSITGGTGAGIFLQLPYYIRNYIKKEMGITSIRTRGMFISADITKEQQPSKINRDAVQVNAYACMKELNAFFLTQADKKVADNLELEYFEKNDIRNAKKEVKKTLRENQLRSVDDLDFNDEGFLQTDEADIESLSDESSGNIPYDTFYLIEGTNNKGTTGNATIPTLERQVAKIIYTLLFTPVKGREESTADNFILAQMEGDGMNRYSSAGLTAIRYPKEAAVEYVTARWVQDLVQSEWLLLDDKIEAEKLDADVLRKSDPNYKIPTLHERYPQLFAEEVSGGAGKKLAFLREDAYLVDPEDPEEFQNKADLLIEQIESAAAGIFDSDDIRTAKDKCSPAMDELINLQDAAAAKAVSDSENAMRSFDRLIDRTINEHVADLANRVFPPRTELFSHALDDQLCIYGVLSKVHPVSARVILYSLLNTLDAQIKQLQQEESGYDKNAFQKMDFYGTEEDGIQTASDAIQLIEDQGIFGNKKAKLKKLRNLFKRAVDQHVDEAVQHGFTRVKLNTYMLLQKRIQSLSDNYEVFFRTIRKNIERNSRRISALEKMYAGDSFGEINVYASKEAFRKLYDDYKKGASFTLPGDVEEKIFRAIYRQTLVVLNDAGNEENDYQKRKRDEGITAALEDIFETELVSKLEDTVRTKGKSVLDLTISEAIEKQFQMETGSLPDMLEGKKYAAALLDYERALIDRALRRAAPMVSTADEVNTAETIYLAMHPLAGVEKDGKVDAGATAEYFVPAKGEATDMQPVCVLLDEEFSPCEITCVKAKHNLMIENLTKYAKNGDYYNRYMERINMLGKNPAEKGEFAYKTVVNPHINRYWHEMAFIPAIGRRERIKEAEGVRVAFINAFAYDFIDHSMDDQLDNRMAWHFIPRDGVSGVILKKGSANIQDFAELYDAFRYNGKMVAWINSLGKKISDKERGYRSEEDMLGWIQGTTFVTNLCGGNRFRKNILDILLGMYEGTAKDEWEKLFDALREAVFEYLHFMFGGVVRYVNDSYRPILDLIYSYSGLSREIPDPWNADLRSYQGETGKKARLVENYRRISGEKFS